MTYRPPTLEVLAAGMQTTVQDHPGRLGYWSIGVPPSGPMDDLAFRLANRLLGNDPGAAGLEIILSGPTLRFDTAALVAITGAPVDARLDGKPVPGWEILAVPAGATLSIGAVTGPGVALYRRSGRLRRSRLSGEPVDVSARRVRGTPRPGPRRPAMC